MHRVMCILTIISLLLFSSAVAAQRIDNNELTIENAVKNGIENNYELQILLKAIDVSAALKMQSSLYPNPEFAIEAENILGSNDFSGLRGSEITASLSQNILLAGKLSKLEKVSEMDISLAEWDYEAKRLEIATDIRKAFTKAMVIQKLIEKNNELFKISNELVLNLNERVKVGRISPAEVSRAKIILNNLEIEISSLNSEYESSVFELSILINDPNLIIESVDGEVKFVEEIIQYDSLYTMLENNPNLKRFESEYSRQKAVISYEESKSVPDLTLSAGYRRLSEINANTFLIGASMPIPIFDSNQGNIQASRIDLDKKRLEYEQTKNRFTLKLNLLYNRLRMLIDTSSKLKSGSIPEAVEAFRIIKEGNLRGRFTILDMLDVERTLFEIENQYLNIQGEINTLLVEIEGLTTKIIN